MRIIMQIVIGSQRRRHPSSPASPRTNHRASPWNFPQATRSFIGHLEGTGKSLNTIQNYRYDLEAFGVFLEKTLSSKKTHLKDIRLEDIHRYSDYLKSLGYKSNTRRRHLMTLRKLFRYLNQRKKFALDLSGQVATPHKIERIPLTESLSKLKKAIAQLPSETSIELRNRILLATLAETGCLVHEIAKSQFDHWSLDPKKGATLQIFGKNPRVLGISRELFQSVQLHKKRGGDTPWLFLGHNKFGPLNTGPITPRGIELLIVSLAPQLGLEKLTPRQIRHSFVRFCLENGMPLEDLRKQLGLRTTYAFKNYAQWQLPEART